MSGFVSNIVSRAQRHAKYREIVNELSALSPRDLADIGLSESDIYRVARTSVYG